MPDAADDPIAASQRLQNSLQKMIDEAEAEEQQEKEMSDTQVALRRYGLTRETRHRVKQNPPAKIRQTRSLKDRLLLLLFCL